MVSEIFVVDDDYDMREALTAVFDNAGYRVREFADGGAFLRIARSELPACVLLDICMPESSGLEVLRELDAKSYPAPVLILSGQGDVFNVVRAIKYGAFDFIEKRFDGDAILSRVTAAIDDWTRTQGRKHSSCSPSYRGCDRLTPREREVLSQITAAASNKEAARNLGISPRTVEIHRSHIMQKLGAKNSVDLIRIVMNNPAQA
ncbi:MAG: response regulator [Xanthobacteraceae bacterium]|jgi:two-component system response regulator FixJ